MFSMGFLNKNKKEIRRTKQVNPLLTSNNILKTYGNIKKKNL